MTKPPAPFKLDLTATKAGGPPAAAASRPAAAPPAGAARAGGSARGSSVPPDCKSLTFYPSKAAHLQLRLVAGREERTAGDLLLDALDLLFAERGLSRIARPTPKAAAE